MKLLLLIVKNIGRNKLRSLLTGLGTMILVFMVTLIWSVLVFLDQQTTEKSRNVKAIVTERWQIPSRMPFSYIEPMKEFAWKDPQQEQPLDSMMTWQFFGGTVDAEGPASRNAVFAIALEPRKLFTMMEELDTLPPDEKEKLQQIAAAMERDPQDGLIVGPGRLKALNKQVGDRIRVKSFNYRDIELEFTIVGVFPPGRYDLSAAMNRDYLNRALEAYARTHGRSHEMMEKTLNLVWLRFPTVEQLNETAAAMQASPKFTSPAIKCETASSGIATFLDAYRDLLNGLRYLLVPAVLVTLAMVISNSISIGVRERRMEIAVLKVLGFRPYHIMALVLGEALLLGVLGGCISAWGTYFVVNKVLGGFGIPVAFFGKFLINPAALVWGPLVGGATALVGSWLPSKSASAIKVAEVFAKVG